MTKLILPTILFLVVGLIFLYLSKKNKSKAIAALFTVFSAIGIVLLLAMLYGETIAVSQEKQRHFLALSVTLVVLLAIEAFEAFGKLEAAVDKNKNNRR